MAKGILRFETLNLLLTNKSIWNKESSSNGDFCQRGNYQNIFALIDDGRIFRDDS